MSNTLFARAPAAIAGWHAFFESRDPAALDAVLAEDVVFESPVVHRPQVGKPITRAYLLAATDVLGGPSFAYLDAWYGETSAVLEFSCDLQGDDGKTVLVNGVDMIAWNPEGRINRFKVMIRPLKAINAVHALMGARLAQTGARP